MLVPRYVVRDRSMLRFGVWDTEKCCWVEVWGEHSFPTSEGIAEHRAWYLNCDEMSRES